MTLISNATFANVHLHVFVAFRKDLDFLLTSKDICCFHEETFLYISHFTQTMAVLPDKQVKKEFKKVASENPEKFYPTEVLKELGFMRKQCSCGTFFWTTNAYQQRCGDPSCSG